MTTVMNLAGIFPKATCLHESTAARYYLSMVCSYMNCTTVYSPPGLYLTKCASTRVSKRLEKLGIGPDGKPLPTANVKKVFPRMYKVTMVNQDGSTFTIRHRWLPHKIITLPLDLSTLSPEELQERERVKLASKARVYVQDDILEQTDKWDQRQYRKLLKRKTKKN